MDLTLQWGRENLDLDGTVDADWTRWRAGVLHADALHVDGNGDGDDDNKANESNHIPAWCSNPPKRLDIWTEKVSDEAKKRRQGFVYSSMYATRFCRRRP